MPKCPMCGISISHTIVEVKFEYRAEFHKIDSTFVEEKGTVIKDEGFRCPECNTKLFPLVQQINAENFLGGA